MGGKEATEKELTEELGKELLNDANAKLKAAGKPEQKDLADALDSLARVQFNKDFGYEYGSKPTGLKDGGSFVVLAKLCNVKKPSEAEQYIKDVILKEVPLPDWMQAATANDLNGKTAGLLSEPLGWTWRYDKYANRFEADDEHQRSIETNGTIVYAHADKSRDKATATVCAIYFMAVYYDVQTQKAVYRQEVKKEAYDAAKHLTGATTITNDEDLKRALETYASSQWTHEFGYAYDAAKPKDFEGGEAATLVRNRALKYLQEADAETTKNRINRFITDEFFQAINTSTENPGAGDDKKVKDEGVKGWAASDLLAGVVSTIDQPSPGQWTSRKFDKEYVQPMDPGLNSIRGHVLYYVFQLTKTTDKGDEVTVKYIHCQGVFYEVIPALKVVTKELYIELCANLKKGITNYVPTGKAADDPGELRNILLSFGKQEFLKKFGFQWKETLEGKDIPGYQSKMVPRVYNVLFDFTATDPGRQLIENRVGLGAFKKDGWEFPWKPKDPSKHKAIQEVLFNDLCDRIELLSKPEGGVPKEGNLWYNIGNTVQYPPDPDTPTSFVKQYFFYVYVLGKKAGREAKVETLFVYYLSVFCGEPEPDWPFFKAAAAAPAAGISHRVAASN